MTPNLTRLFELAIDDLDANERISDLFTEHGEALIDALERLLEENEDYIKINHLSAMGNVNLVNARQLLAQLESEAQP